MIFKRKPVACTYDVCTSTQGVERSLFHLAPDCRAFESGLYEQLRSCVPIVDCCIAKIVRLVGDFSVVCESSRSQTAMNQFVKECPVGISGKSIYTFADMYLDSLLTYGRALGEFIVDEKYGQIQGLYVADSCMFKTCHGKNPVDRQLYSFATNTPIKISHPERLLYTCLNPSPKNPEGVSILRGIPRFADILMTVYNCIGNNFERAGNVRYAVSYKPENEADMAYAKDRAMDIAKEWSDGMQSARCGVIKDFVAVGDVGIKVIGADNQIIDTEIPVRQIIEQIVSKLSIPPFLLGLSWSNTERMASQQADILTSELEYYRRLLSPVLEKICSEFLYFAGLNPKLEIQWANINLQDEESLAQARLYNAQAEQIEIQNEKERRVENAKS